MVCFLLHTEDTIKWFDYMPFPKVVSCHQFVLGKQPKEDMNLRWHCQFPNPWQKQGCTPLKLITWYKELEE